MKKKLVSVIIPTFNRANSIADAIISVKNQTYQAVQIIVIDDGSQDNTGEIVKNFKNVIYHYQENKGQAAARNAGLKYAKGEYLASLDSDDIWNRDFLANGVECLEKHDLDFVFLNWTSLNGRETYLDYWQKEQIWRKYVQNQDNNWLMVDSCNLRKILLTGCPAPTSSLILRRKSTVRWNENVLVADDWLLLLEMVISKPCRAAFTFVPHWSKRVFGDNIYDCRDALQVAENSLFDDNLMSLCIYERLSFREKLIFRKRLSLNHLNFVYLNLRNGIINKSLLFNLFTALILAPITVSIFTAKIFTAVIKPRLKIGLPKEVSPINEL